MNSKGKSNTTQKKQKKPSIYEGKYDMPIDPHHPAFKNNNQINQIKQH